jgi:hypothetical protein
MKAWLVSIAAVVAAVALLATNLDKILTVSAKWLGPYLVPYIRPQANMAIRLDDNITAEPDVFVSDPANEAHVLAIGHVRHGEPAVLTVSANTLYKIGWQGTNIAPGAVKDVLALKGASAFRLVPTDEGKDEGKGGVFRVTLRPADADVAPLTATEPSAGLLISAGAARVASEPAVVIGAGALPELDRAVAIVGLFETGTTDCTRQVRWFEPPPLGVDPFHPVPKAPSVGCLGMTIPGWLTDVIATIDSGDAHRLDAILGDDAAVVRVNVTEDAKYRNAPSSMESFSMEGGQFWTGAPPQRAMERLISTPEFWVAYQGRVLAAYAQAAVLARQIGLVSERGRLLIFDRLIWLGPAGVVRGVQAYVQRYPETAQDRPDSEKARILAIGNIFKAIYPRRLHGYAVERIVTSRIDTIVSGHGLVRGISFDLEHFQDG